MVVASCFRAGAIGRVPIADVCYGNSLLMSRRMDVSRPRYSGETLGKRLVFGLGESSFSKRTDVVMVRSMEDDENKKARDDDVLPDSLTDAIRESAAATSDAMNSGFLKMYRGDFVARFLGPEFRASILRRR